MRIHKSLRDIENTLMVIWEKEEGRLKLEVGINIHQLLRIK